MADREPSAAATHAAHHLEEARGVTTWGGGQHQIEIQLGHVCNNRCVFCVSGQLTEQRVARPIPADPVLAALEKARSEGVRKVTFLGGEPTVQRSFLPALERAVALGFEEIVLFTNGVKTRKSTYIDRIVALGDFTWRFSIQGGNEAAHDEVVGRRGAFQRIVTGLAYLQELGQDVTANMCVNTLSYPSLPDFPELIERYGVRQLHIDMVRPADTGVRTKEYLRSIIPRYSDMAPSLRTMLQGFDRIDPAFDVNIGNYPYCLLPEYAHKIHHDGELTYTIAADGQSQLSAPWNKYEQKRSDKQHPPQCGGCVFRGQCNGVFDDYVAFYGTDELQPVTLEALRELDTPQHFFVLLVDDALQPLLGSTPPEGWAADEVFRNTRDRFVEVRYRHAGSGARAILRFVPPVGVGRPVEAPTPLMATERFQVSLMLDRGPDARDVGALLAWARDGLDQGGAVTWTRPLDVPRLIAGLIEPRRLQRARRRMLGLVRKVEHAGTFGQWRHAGTEPLATSLGVSLQLAGPAGQGAEVLLEVQSDPARPLVAVGYRVAPGTDHDAARDGLARVMATLRSRLDDPSAASAA